LIPKRTTTRSRPAISAAVVTSADAMSASRAGAPAVCESCKTRNVSLAISRNESAVERGVDRGDGGQVEIRAGILSALVKLTVEVGEQRAVEGVELRLIGLTFRDAGPNSGNVEECRAECLADRVIRQRVAH